ncbi:hypothetical protein [Neptuniibacter sp. QD37_11]|uniref:hypothetical protein n=1 Tax=Neptuniibacter sp. QD37_11 TaxID=3398209 RepID=UPI0039F46067
MKRVHFDLGDSNNGPIGMCAVMHADTEEQALEKLKESLPPSVMVPVDGLEKPSEYIEIYINADNITINNIDDVECDEGDAR